MNTMQNNGIIHVVKSMYFYTLKDKTPIMAFINKSRRSTTQNLNNKSIQTNELRFTMVYLDKVGYKGESFIMTSHVK
ncbi:hypothetical protein CR513_38170, partial [Mucuna pruriens]